MLNTKDDGESRDLLIRKVKQQFKSPKICKEKTFLAQKKSPEYSKQQDILNKLKHVKRQKDKV